MSEEEIDKDNRGWMAGQLRNNTLEAKERIKTFRKKLINEGSYFYGAPVIKENYELKYGEKISLWFVNNTLKEYGMVKSPQPYQSGKSQ